MPADSSFSLAWSNILYLSFYAFLIWKQERSDSHDVGVFLGESSFSLITIFSEP